MRPIVLILSVLLVLVQYPLWLGKGGWLRVWDLDRQVGAQQRKNEDLRARNARLEGEVKDLREGRGAIEERARLEFGMIKEGETFVQLLGTPPLPGSATAPAAQSGAQAAAPGSPGAAQAQPQGAARASAKH